MSAFQVILVVIARLTTSMEMGQLIQEHCSCKVPCMCGCQALAQNVFLRQRAHADAMLCLLRQGKVHMALHYAQARGALDRDVLLHLLKQCPSVQLVETLLTEEEPRAEGGVADATADGRGADNAVRHRSMGHGQGLAAEAGVQ